MRFYKLALSLIILACYTFEARAQGSIYSSEIKPDGQTYEVVLNPATDSAINTVELYFYSKGNSTSPIQLSVQGPALATVQLQNSILGAGLAAQAQDFIPMPLKTSGAKKTKTTFTLKAEPIAPEPTGGGGTPTGGTGICSFLPASQIKALLDFYRLLLGRNVTKEEICNGTNPFDPNLDPINNTPNNNTSEPPPATIDGALELSGLFYKDACKPDRTRYLSKIVIDLSKVDPALRQSELALRASVRITPYKGKQAASIKPVSDGKFAPAPLLLMSSLGGFFPGSEKIHQVTWKRKGFKIKELKVYDYVFYRGLILTRTPMSGLKGGKATFALTNDYSSYSVCFALKKKRQKVNGYPG